MTSSERRFTFAIRNPAYSITVTGGAILDLAQRVLRVRSPWYDSFPRDRRRAHNLYDNSYIVVVNPAILSTAGIPEGPSFVATVLVAVAGCYLMAFYANRPFAIAPCGLGSRQGGTGPSTLGDALCARSVSSRLFYGGSIQGFVRGGSRCRESRLFLRTSVKGLYARFL